MYSPVNRCVIFQSANAVYFPRRSDTPDAVRRSGAFLKISVSAITTTTVNGILSLDKNSIDYMVSKKGMTINVNSTDRTTQILIRNMINLLKELQNDYKEYIEIK